MSTERQTTNTFDAALHRYTILGRPVPSVTQILQEVLGSPFWNATELHREIGSTVHACAAMIAQGKHFDLDLSNQEPATAANVRGRIAACRKFFAEVEPVNVIDVEQQVYSVGYQFAGTFDLKAAFQGGKIMLIDWKSSLTAAVPLQLAGYHIADDERETGIPAPYGLGVELHKDGTYKCSEVYDLRKYVNQFLALRSVFSIKSNLGYSIKKEKHEDSQRSCVDGR